MTLHKPGWCFWLVTRTTDVFSPGTGKRRIDARLDGYYSDLQEERVRNSELTSENSYLRRELLRVEGQRNLLLIQDDMNTVIHGSPTNLPFSNAVGAWPLNTVNEPLAKA